MAYTDYNGMVRPGDMAVSNNPTYNGASTWSPWAGDLPGAYEAGFEMRNYAPGGYRGQTGQALKPTTPAQISAPVQPLTPIAPLHFGSAGGGNTPAPASSGGGIGTYQTGIQSGLLSNDAIAAARARLQPTAPMPTANVPTNPAQQSQMAQQYQDLISQGTLKADMGLTRDAAYQQAQMGLAQQKALAGAATAGMGNLVGLDAQNTQYNSANNSADTAQRGIQQGLLLRILQGLT
jgi:hypothetical protein